MAHEGLRQTLADVQATVRRRGSAPYVAAWAHAQATIGVAAQAVQALKALPGCEVAAVPEITQVVNALGLASREMADVRPFFSVTVDLEKRLAAVQAELAAAEGA